MAYDPYEPPQPYPPAYPDPLPYQPLPPQPSRSTGRTVAIVAGAVAAALLLIPALIAVMVFASGTIVDDVVPSRPFPSEAFIEPVPHRVAADDSGAAFTVPVPPYAVIVEATGDPWLGDTRVVLDLGRERVAVATYPKTTAETAEQALAETAAELRPRGLDEAGTPREYLVGGQQRALLQRLRVRRSTETEVWVAVFVRGGARWVVLYEGPTHPAMLGEPPALDRLAEGWQW